MWCYSCFLGNVYVRLYYFCFFLFGVSIFFSLYNNNNNSNNNINSNNNNYNNNSNSNNRSIIILYISVGFYLSLYAFILNVIIDTYFFKGNISPAA